MPPNFNPLGTSFKRNPCIIDKYIHTAKLFFYFFNKNINTVLIADIQLHHMNPIFVFRRNYFLSGFLRQLEITTRHYYFVRFGREVFKNSESDAFVAARQYYRFHFFIVKDIRRYNI
jgi:hypothetical protein